MTSIHTLWDIPSSSQLAESIWPPAIQDIIVKYVQHNGEEALVDLLLGISDPLTGEAIEVTGVAILKTLENDRLAHIT